MPLQRIFGKDDGKTTPSASTEGATRNLGRKLGIFEDPEDNHPARDEGGTARYPPPDTTTKPVTEAKEEKTRLFRPGGQSGEQVSSTPTPGNRPNPMDDPVVGWLVIVEGPGKGAFRPLGYGMNSIGRSTESRVCLDFGDEQLSRSNHAVVVYDPRGRKFYVQHGGGRNLTYLDNALVQVPMELAAGQDMILGNTRLRFMPFCGATFDWQDA